MSAFASCLKLRRWAVMIAHRKILKLHTHGSPSVQHRPCRSRFGIRSWLCGSAATDYSEHVRAGELDELARQPGSRGAADGHACERFRKAPDHHVRRYVRSRPGTKMSSQVRRPKAVGDKTERKAICTPNSS